VHFSGQKNSNKNSKKQYCIYFPVLIQARKRRRFQGQKQGQNKVLKKSKKVLHLFSGLDTTMQNQGPRRRAKKVKKVEKKYCIFFETLIQAHQSNV